MHEPLRDVGIAQNSPAQLLAALLSGKRSLDGNAGKCPTTGLQNELSDDKIGGRNNGQKSEQWH